MQPTNGTIWVASIDIGKVNFCFTIEEFNATKLRELRAPKVRYYPNGEPTFEMTLILNQVFMNGKVILAKNSDITQNCNAKMKLDPETFHNMDDLLTSYLPYFDHCSYVIIERQMMFGRLTNPMAVKLAQHCYSFFVYTYGRAMKVIEYDAFQKTQILGSKMLEVKNKKGVIKYKAIDKPSRKKWSIAKCEEILTMRNDVATLTLFKTKNVKKDDIADTINQLQAFKIQRYIDRVV